MKNKTPFPMTPFDMLVVPEHLHIMKLFLPYLPSGTQKILAVWIKYMELHNTLAYFRNFPHFGLGECLSPKQAGAMEIFEKLRPYMKEDEAEQIDMALSAMSMMEMMNAAIAAEEHQPSRSAPVMMPSVRQSMFDLYSQMFEKGGEAEDESEGQPVGGMDEESCDPNLDHGNRN